MQNKKWGEDQFVESLAKLFPSSKGIKGIGDDTAVIPAEGDRAWLVTTDALVEGVHFLKEQISAKDLGYKTVAVNVSDITAMGGDSHYAFLSIAVPRSIGSSWAYEVIEGLKEACDKWHIQLLGGDTVGSKGDLFINLTLIGSAAKSRIKYRDSAQAGDVIAVTGYLGDSGGGFRALQTKIEINPDARYLIKAHFRPEPFPEQGKWLASHPAVHAMMDISDGLDCDLKRLLKMSKKGAFIDINQIPISPSLSTVSKEKGWDALQLSLTGGEDYCLLCTVDSKSFESLKQAFQQQFKHTLFAIGYIDQSTDQLVYQRNGTVFPIHYSNFSHF